MSFGIETSSCSIVLTTWPDDGLEGLVEHVLVEPLLLESLVAPVDRGGFSPCARPQFADRGPAFGDPLITAVLLRAGAATEEVRLSG